MRVTVQTGMLTLAPLEDAKRCCAVAELGEATQGVRSCVEDSRSADNAFRTNSRHAEANRCVVKRIVPRPCCIEWPQAVRCSFPSASLEHVGGSRPFEQARGASLGIERWEHTKHECSPSKVWMAEVGRTHRGRTRAFRRKTKCGLRDLVCTNPRQPGYDTGPRREGKRIRCGAVRCTVLRDLHSLLSPYAQAPLSSKNNGVRVRWLGFHTDREHADERYDEGILARACVPL